MISSQIGNKLSFWVESTLTIKHIIAAMSVYMDSLVALGYVSEAVYVGGGVHELDTGYERFDRKYNSFEEMKEHLCIDFKTEEEKLDGMWMDTLNFEFIGVSLRKGDVTGRLDYCRGFIELDCGTDETEIEERCRDSIAQYLYKEN